MINPNGQPTQSSRTKALFGCTITASTVIWLLYFLGLVGGSAVTWHESGVTIWAVIARLLAAPAMSTPSSEVWLLGLFLPLSAGLIGWYLWRPKARLLLLFVLMPLAVLLPYSEQDTLFLALFTLVFVITELVPAFTSGLDGEYWQECNLCFAALGLWFILTFSLFAAGLPLRAPRAAQPSN